METHAHVVGSLMRPDYLHRAREQRASGEITVAEFKQIEDRAVDEAIALQEAAGLAIVNDGEVRRGHFSAPLTEAISGVSPVQGFVHRWHTADGSVDQAIPVAITSRIRRTRSFVAEEFVYARARADATVKVTVPSPTMILYLWSKEHSRDAYSDPFELVSDAAGIVRAEIAELASLGCTEVQIDAPELTFLVDPQTREWQEQEGVPAERMLTEGIDLMNSVADVPGVRFSVHLCRGNGSTDRWLAKGGYDSIAQAIFSRTPNLDAYLLEYDDTTITGGFAPLANAPADKELILGLVSTKSAVMETADELRARVQEAAGYFPLEQLGLSTQCGFASRGEARPMTGRDQEAKLKLVSEVAASIW